MVSLSPWFQEGECDNVPATQIFKSRGGGGGRFQPGNFFRLALVAGAFVSLFAVAALTAAALLAPPAAEAQSKEIMVIKPTFDLEEGALSSKTIWLGAKPTGTVTVGIAISNPSDVVVTADKSTLTYNPSTYAKGQFVLFGAVNDTDTTAGTATVTLTANGGGYSNVTKTMSITVIETTDANNNTPRAGIEVNKSSASVREGGSSETFFVKITAKPTGTAVVNATSSDTAAVRVTSTGNSTSRTFTAWNYNNDYSRTFSVTAVQDADALDESVTITFSSTYEWEYTDPSTQKKARITSTVSQKVTVTVNDDETLTNSAPTVSSAIADQYVSSSGTGTVALGSVFSDSDSGDTLTYQANSGNGNVATVAVSSSTLTITAVSTGVAEITVSAIDSRGASVADTFLVYVGVTGGGTLVATNLNVGASATYDLKKKFRGPSSMTFAASSSNDTNVGTSISSGVLTVSAKAAGSATVTVTATAGSDSKTARFTVNVNRVPTVANPISDVTMANGASTTVALANVFSDADNDTLGLSASPSNSAALTVSVSGTTLSLTAKLHTIVSVRVIANDGNSQVQDEFIVTINSAPTVANAVTDAGPLTAGNTLTVDMNNVFSDADSDYFTFNVTTSDSSVATVSWSNGTLTVTGVAAGTATITMTASDNYGGSVSDAFAVTVAARVGGNSPPPDNNDPNDPPYQPPVLIGLVLGGNSDPDFNGQTLEVQHVTADSTACLDVKWGNASDGQDVWTWDCNDTNAQKWTFEKRTAGAYKDSYRLVSKLGNYCLDNRGDFTTSDRMGIWSCVADTHGAAANQSVTIASSGSGYTLTFSNGSSSVWLVTDRASSNPKGGANQTTVSGTAGASAIWRIVSD